MVVTSSNIGMSASSLYTYSTQTATATSYTTGAGDGQTSYMSLFFDQSTYSEEQTSTLLATSQQTTSKLDDLIEQTGSDLLGTNTVSASNVSNADSASLSSKSLNSMKSSLLLKLLEIFFAKNKKKLAQLKEEYGLSDISSGSGGTTTWTLQTTSTTTVSETQSMSFAAEGTAYTADGRALTFNVNVEMSQEFYQQSGYSYTQTGTMLTDPLTIWLDDNPDVISDQTFKFDLDSDGIAEEHNSLAHGKGFLAYDKNEDGIINNGSELFGPGSGNGFSELARFDDDGNGWIDEADSIYDHLKVWTKDDDGKDKLLNLKQADVGAIYLGNAASEMTMRNLDGQATARLRSSGIYLHENGNAGVIQQIDI